MGLSHYFRKLLSLTLIFALLALRLSSFSEQAYVEPVEDAIFDVAFIAAEDSAGEGKPIKVKTKRALDLALCSIDALPHHPNRPQPPASPKVPVLILKDIHSEIFIPPESRC